MKVFVSYAHKQGAWVWGRLVPVLKAGGAEVLIDHERFEAGLAVVGQMDDMQDQAERQLICWTADHAASDACRHEWRRALAKDPGFQSGLILLARLDGAKLPAELPGTEGVSRSTSTFATTRSPTRGNSSFEAARPSSALQLRPGSAPGTRLPRLSRGSDP